MEQLNQMLMNGHGLEQILNFVFNGLSNLIPFERMCVGLLTEDKKIRLHWIKSHYQVEQFTEGYTVTLANGYLIDLVETGRPRIIPDLVEFSKMHPESQFTKLAIEDGVRSSLTYPLIAQGRPLGAVFFSSRTPNQFSLEHAEMFSAVAGDVAIILEEALLNNFFDQDETQD